MGGLGGQKCKSLENLPNYWTDWHQIWYTSADSSRNGHRLKTISLSIHQGSFWGGFYGSKIQKSGISTKRLDRLAPNLYTSADSYGNGHRLKTNSPSRPGGHFGV